MVSQSLIDRVYAFGQRFQVSSYTVKPRNSEHLVVLKNLSVIERCPLLGGNF